MKTPAKFSHVFHICGAGILAASISITQAHAASLQVAPILLEFSPQEKVKELWLTNTGNENIRAQVRVNAWTQSNQQDILANSKDLIASPMVISIPAGQRQLVRLIRNTQIANTTEQAYRLIVDELPNSQTNVQSGLQLLLKYSIPVFLKVSDSNDTDQGITSLQGISFKYNTQTLTINNQSSHYKRFSQFAYIDAHGKKNTNSNGIDGLCA